MIIMCIGSTCIYHNLISFLHVSISTSVTCPCTEVAFNLMSLSLIISIIFHKSYMIMCIVCASSSSMILCLICRYCIHPYVDIDIFWCSSLMLPGWWICIVKFIYQSFEYFFEFHHYFFSFCFLLVVYSLSWSKILIFTLPSFLCRSGGLDCSVILCGSRLGIIGIILLLFTVWLLFFSNIVWHLLAYIKSSWHLLFSSLFHSSSWRICSSVCLSISYEDEVEG